MNPSRLDSPPRNALGDGRLAIATDTPGTVDELRESVRSRVAESMAIYPRGGATALDYGGIPRDPGVAIDTTALNRVIDYPFADMTITVEAGITLGALQTVLREHGQRLLIDAPPADQATIGGIYATNTSGPRRFGAGGPRDQILGVSFVNGEGVLLKGGGRVVKNVAGYDFPRLLTGSMGTLGIITQMTLKVRPLPEASALAWIPQTSLDRVETTLTGLNTSTARPIAVEVLDRQAASRLGATGNLPITDWQVIVGIEDSATSVNWQIEQLQNEFKDANVQAVREAEASALCSALTQFQSSAAGPLTFRANLLPSFVPTFLKRLDPALWATQARAGNGLVFGHWLGAESLETVQPILDTLRAEAVGCGGNLVLPRCPTAWKNSLKIWGEPRGDWPLAERLKKAFDPRGVLNPGRFIASI